MSNLEGKKNTNQKKKLQVRTGDSNMALEDSRYLGLFLFCSPSGFANISGSK